MKLINTDGMAFVGPGSEWFWTALSGIVLAVTFLAIYRQLRIARSANAFAQMDALGKEWVSERMTRHRLSVYLALRAGTAPALISEGAVTMIGDFWDNVAMLVRAGHLDRSLLAANFSYPVQLWWALLAPAVHGNRDSHKAPGFYEGFEWLAADMAERDEQAHAGIVFDDAYLATVREAAISQNQDMLRVEQGLRTVTVAPPDAADVGSPASGG